MRKTAIIILTGLIVCSSIFLCQKETYGSQSITIYVDGKQRSSITSEKLLRLPKMKISTKEGPKECVLLRDLIFSQGIGPRQKIMFSRSDGSIEFFWEKLMQPSSRVCAAIEDNALSIYSEKPEILSPEGFLKGVVRIDLRDEIVTVEPEEREKRKHEVEVNIRGKSLVFHEWGKIPVKEINIDGGKKRRGWLLSDLMKKLHIEGAKGVKISGAKRRDLLQLTSADLKKYGSKTIFFINKEGVICLESPKSMIEKGGNAKEEWKGKKLMRKKHSALIKNIKRIEFI